MNRTRLGAAVCALALACASRIAAEPRLARFEFSQPHMGTQFRIVVYAPDAETARAASDAAFRRICAEHSAVHGRHLGY